MIDFDQSLIPPSPAAASPTLPPYDLHWVEEPWRARIFKALRGGARETISIQAGENWWFPRGFAEAIAVDANDLVMPDLMKVGGVTGWMRVAAQAEASSIPMSAICLPRPAPTCSR